MIRLSVLDYHSVFHLYRLCIDFQISLKFEDQAEEEKVFPEDQAADCLMATTGTLCEDTCRKLNIKT